MKKLLFVNFSDFIHVPRFKNLEEEMQFKGLYTNFKEMVVTDTDIYFEDEAVTSFDYVLLGTMGKYLEASTYFMKSLDAKGLGYFRYGCPKHEANKLNEYYQLQKFDIPRIKSIISSPSSKFLATRIAKELNFPIIAKPVDGSKGNGVVKLENLKDISTLEKELEDYKLYIFQEFVPNDGDYRVFILKDKILGIMKREPNKDNQEEFRSNISQGGIGYLSDLPEDVKNLALRATREFNLDIAGVDVIQNKQTGEYLIMEVNQAPQFAGLEKYLPDIDVVKEILKLILV